MEIKIEPRLTRAIEGIESALTVLANGDVTIASVRQHMAETDHPFTIRLIDLDVFGMRCDHCPDQHYEWRPRI